MAEDASWTFPDSFQPKDDEIDFDLQSALDAVVGLRAEVPEDAFTASILGTERIGSGVVIREDGLILTIGYLITEAETVWLTTNAGVAVEGFPVAYDQVTGFGLVQPLGRLGVAPLPRGSVSGSPVGSEVFLIGSGGRGHALKATLFAKREFAGYWEYLLDEALFTTPAHPQWGGAALLDAGGWLIGIGSLFVEELVGGRPVQGNMIVPIDLLEPVLDAMLRTGRPDRPPRPWLGMYTGESRGQLVVGALAEGGPAERAGVEEGDNVLAVAGTRVAGLAELFRAVWRLGSAGTVVPLTLARDGRPVEVAIRSADRNEFLKRPRLH